MKSIPLSPPTAAPQVEGASFPTGVTAPRPVTTIRFAMVRSLVLEDAESYRSLPPDGGRAGRGAAGPPTAGSTSRSGTAFAACSRTRVASSRSGAGTAGRCSATSRSCDPLGDKLPPHSALDGEIVISQDGKLDFDSMQLRLHPAESRVRKLAAEIPAEFIAFDVLLWNGEPVHELPLADRRALPREEGQRRSASRPCSHDLAQAKRWLERLEAAGLDGVICKKLHLPYLPGSRDGVVKVKPHRTADCVIVGFRWSEKVEGKISTLLLGLYNDEGDARLRRALLGHLRARSAAAAGTAPAARRAGLHLRRAHPRRPEPLVARQGAGLESRPPRARVRGALRQAREEPVQTRDAASCASGRTRIRRTAPGARSGRRGGAATRPSSRCSA